MATPFLTTVGGTATSLVPLSTVWSSAGAECAQAIYQQIGGSFLGWDPWYVHNIDGGLTTCWPPQASSWWNQDASPSTSLGPTFVCPGAYHEAYTSSVNSHKTRTICCPSGYDIYVADFAKTIFPSQCTSTLAAGETLSWEKIYYESDLGDTWTPTSTTVQSEALTIFGIPVNGLNIAATSTSTPSSSSSAGAETISPAGTTATAPTASSSHPSSSDSSSGSTNIVGVAVGASVGAVVGVLLFALGAFFVWRRRRHGDRSTEANGPTGPNTPGAWNSYSSTSEPAHTRGIQGYYAPGGQHAYELKGSHPATHELAVDGHIDDAYELPVGNVGRN